MDNLFLISLSEITGNIHVEDKERGKDDFDFGKAYTKPMIEEYNSKLLINVNKVFSKHEYLKKVVYDLLKKPNRKIKDSKGLFLSKHIEIEKFKEDFISGFIKYKTKFVYAKPSDYIKINKDYIRELNLFIELSESNQSTIFEDEKIKVFNVPKYSYEVDEFTTVRNYTVLIKKEAVTEYTPNFFIQYYNFVLDFIKEFEKDESLVNHKPKEKIKPKNGWSLIQRYELFNSLGFLDVVQKQSDLSEKDKHTIIAYLLDCNVDNARKLFTGTYNKGRVNKDEITNLLEGYKPPKHK